MTAGTPRLLLAAAGEPWEAHVLTLLAAPGTPAALARRCVDVPDVVAAAAAGQGTAAVVSVELAGLDPDVVARLRETGIGVVAVASGATAAARARGLGLDPVLDAGAVSTDPAVVLAAVARLVEAGGLTPDEGPLPPASTDHAHDGADSGRVVAVWGPTGAPGRSTVGLGLAAAAADAGVQTLLVDADVYGGATAQMLAVLDEVSGVLAAARAASTAALDDVALAEAARQVTPRLRVLTGLPRAERWTALRPAALRHVLSRARRAARLVVVDCGFSLEQDEELSFDTAAPRRNGATLTALADADLVLVVGSADPLGLARLARARDELREAVPAAQVRLVVNRVRGGLGWSRDDVSRTLLRAIGEVPLGYLPLDQAAVDACWVNGRTLPEAVPQSALARGLAGLADAVALDLDLSTRPAHSAGRRDRLRRRVRS